MCGIVGKISPGGVDESLIKAMRDTLTHRGPDDSGLWLSQDKTIALAHRRLSIIDLSCGGHQPMTDQSRRYTIIFNGEIYNHLEIKETLRILGHGFHSTSDTEVLLAAYIQWGRDCLDKLDGMFAMCIYDSHTRELFLARDRAGEKPLFYYHNGRDFSFASELKAMLVDPATPRKIDPAGLNAYLAYGYICGENSLLQGVKKLPAGHCMTYKIETGELDVKPYWQLDDIKADFCDDPQELCEQFHGLLKQSVKRRLIADVPVGILLSGGVDSSLVTAAAAECSAAPVKTFTISFPGHGSYDEGPFARMVADHFGTEHVELPAEDASISLLPELAKQYDEPMADSSMVPTFIVSELIRKHATVAIGGDGGDELFGGYPQHMWIQKLAKLGRIIPCKSIAKFLVERLVPAGKKNRNALLALLSRPGINLTQFNLFFDPNMRKKLMGRRADGLDIFAPELFKLAAAGADDTFLRQATAMDFNTYMCDDILVKVDRASMLTSLEIRAPFLSREIIEFAFSRVPDELRATQTQKKILPRMLAKKLLPAELDIDRKQGFSLPLNSWLMGQWGDYCFEVLRDMPDELIAKKEIDKLIEQQKAGYNHAQRIFSLVMLELWRREYDIEI